MKHFFLCISILSLTSCMDSIILDEIISEAEIPLVTVELEKIYLTDGTIEYFDYYENNQVLKFVKEGTYEDPHSTPEYWIFKTNQQKQIEDCFIHSMTDVGKKHVFGCVERRSLSYSDSIGFSLNMMITVAPNILIHKNSWGTHVERFNIHSASPNIHSGLSFSTFYSWKEIDREEYNNYAFANHTILVDTLEVGNRVYNDVILKTRLRGTFPYLYYATKNDGIIMIKDLGKDVSWVKVDS